MSAPPASASTARVPRRFSIREETPVKVVYKFWVRRPNEDWLTFGPEVTGDDIADRWVILPPLPRGSQFAYWLAVAGHPHATWRVRLTIRQPGSDDHTATWTESGTTSATGEFSMPETVQLELT
ncbi:MAG: hypothetical protein IPK33_14090 [Gemmatimonadetes bacterium]|nr:hypothetical protein [Gemmatimonadota bacterium]